MNIAEAREKCKALITGLPRDVLIIVVLILASSASFGLGYLAGLDVQQGRSTLEMIPLAEVPPPPATTGKFVASKSGTKYYLTSCVGADRISDANKIWFASVSAAEAAGYTPAANCKGL